MPGERSCRGHPHPQQPGLRQILGQGLAIGRARLGAGRPRAALRPGGTALPLPLS